MTAPLPSAPQVSLGQHILLQPPLSRCGYGPGLMIVRPQSYTKCQGKNTSLDPEPVQKWAEESYAVVQITLDVETSADKDHALGLVGRGIESLDSLKECDKSNFAILIYGSPADYAPGFGEILQIIITAVDKKLAAAVYFSPWETSETPIPVLLHIPGSFQPTGPSKHDNQTVYSYADVSSPGFIVPGHSDFKVSSAGVAHTRSLTFLKKHLNGPFFDLEKIWEEHTWYEFGDRSVEKTMATMVQEPYVNHVPTLGLMPEYLPYPYALPGGQLPGPGKRFEYRVPAAGVETAMKLQDEHGVPSNGMFEFKVREVDEN
ncbi:hypothetical protein BBP40_007223 [Aspergillus hancockii]|nr:hypothetical protein BBP40_007223 [Aspergillus hancockii]